MPSVSKSQQRLMGVAYAVKSGDMKINDVDPAYREKVKGLVDGMTKKDLKKYASTKHEDLPETVSEAFIGPYVFNDKMSDEELKAMYFSAIDGYSYYQKGMHYAKSDYKKAYQEIEKILKKRGVSIDEMAGTGAVSLNPGQTIGGMGDVTLPVNGELGSGDLPHAVIQIADIDDDLEKEKKRNKKKVVKNLEMENFNIYTQFNDFLNEAIDHNDPVLIRLRQDKLRRADMAKLDALKKQAEKDRKKAMKRWNDNKYDQWLEDVASNDGWKNAYDMARNAEFEPGLIDWVKKEYPGEDVYQRIQWDIEAFAESVKVTEKYKAKDIIDAWEDAYGEDIMNSDHADVPDDIDNDYRGRVTIKDLEEIFDNRYGEELSPEFLEALGESVVTEGVLSNVRKAIAKTQGALKKKWAKKGGYENFGQDEIRDLQDKYDYNGMVYGTPEERKAAKLIDALDQWAMNYVGESEVKESVVNEKKLDRDEMMAWIKRTMDFVKTTEEFNGSPGGIWVCGECGDEYKGRIIYAYYSEDYKNRTFGVDNKWEKELNKRGWYSEWHDAGTSMIWPN